jgi:membrane fusion protein (multidrug efflux system)
MNTISTEDAYVNGHVTFVAPRVSGQVMKVLVNDNNRVKKGDLLVQLDKEPFQVQVALKRAAVRAAEANLAAAESKARGLEAQLGAQRWKLQNASEQVDAQVALLRSQVAALRSQEATLDRARADFKRAQGLLPSHTMSREEYDLREQQVRVAAASLAQAQEAIAQTRVSLGLAPQPEKGKELTDVPPDLNQTFSAVRMTLADCMQTMTQLGLPLGSIDLTPNQALEEFRRLDKDGDFEQIAKDLIPKVPFVLQAKVALEQARHDLELAELNLRYCDIVSEIDGVVVGRNVNPGNTVQAGQALMVVRSLTEIWIGANFKGDATGPADRPARAMRGGHVRQPQRVRGGLPGSPWGPADALLLPAQRHYRQLRQDRPAVAGRVKLTDYDPDRGLCSSGCRWSLSCTTRPPRGRTREILQPLAALPTKTRTRP